MPKRKPSLRVRNLQKRISRKQVERAATNIKIDSTIASLEKAKHTFTDEEGKRFTQVDDSRSIQDLYTKHNLSRDKPLELVLASKDGKKSGKITISPKGGVLGYEGEVQRIEVGDDIAVRHGTSWSARTRQTKLT